MLRTQPTRAQNLGDLLARLGHISPSRVCLDPPPGRATKRDLVRLHADGGKLYELVDQTLVEKPMGSPEAFLATQVIRMLGKYLDEHDVGFLYAPDALIEVRPKLVRGPDVCFVSWGKRPERTVPSEPISDLIPDLVVEILSPSNTRKEMARKLKEYFLAGVELVWMIDSSARTAEAYVAPDAKAVIGERGTLDGGGVLPGFTLPLAKLFERLERPAKKSPRKRK